MSDILHSSITWARRYRFKLPKDYQVWMHLLPPTDSEPDLELFGKDGKPILIDGFWADDDEEDKKEIIDGVDLSKLSSHYAMERDQAMLHRLLADQDFESDKETDVFIQDLLEKHGGKIPDCPPGDDLEKAQDIVWEAWDEPNPRRAIALAKRALSISPDCADAYIEDPR